MKNQFSIVITTCATKEDAAKIARALLAENLAACIQVLPITSYYTWKDKVNEDAEHLLFIKARTALYSKIEQSIKSNHSYEVPEIVQLPITQGAKSYLDWICEVSRP